MLEKISRALFEFSMMVMCLIVAWIARHDRYPWFVYFMFLFALLFAINFLAALIRIKEHKAGEGMEDPERNE